MKLRRSVGAEVNWGIRFTCEADAENFLDGIAGEVSLSLLSRSNAMVSNVVRHRW